MESADALQEGNSCETRSEGERVAGPVSLAGVCLHNSKLPGWSKLRARIPTDAVNLCCTTFILSFFSFYSSSSSAAVPLFPTPVLLLLFQSYVSLFDRLQCITILLTGRVTTKMQ